MYDTSRTCIATRPGRGGALAEVYILAAANASPGATGGRAGAFPAGGRPAGLVLGAGASPVRGPPPAPSPAERERGRGETRSRRVEGASKVPFKEEQVTGRLS